MEYMIIIARSVTQAQRMMHLLENCGIWAKIFRSPVGLTEYGMQLCGKNKAREAMAGDGMPASGRSDAPFGPRKAGGRLPRGEGMIYLDSGATTLEKPPEVARAMAGRWGLCRPRDAGIIRPPGERSRRPFACREAAAGLFQVPTPDQVVFTSNATHGLNIAIRSLVRPGGRVAISGYEHNAVTRVLHSIPGVEMIVADAPLFAPEKILEGFHRALAPGRGCGMCATMYQCVRVRAAGGGDCAAVQAV